MTKRRITIALAAVVCALGAAAAVRASIPDGAGVIHGCYAKSAAPGSQPGALRVVDTALGQTCTLSEGAVNWSQTGPPGPQGPQGAQGPQGTRGPTGSQGAPGANAYFAGTGLALSGGNTFGISGSYQLPQGCSSGQSPYLLGAPLTHPWSCFTAANANENCAAGKFQNGVDASGDITCAAPPASAGPGVWSTSNGEVNTPQNADTTVATLSLPAGAYLVEVSLMGADDLGGNGNVDMYCKLDSGGGSTWMSVDAVFVPLSFHQIVTLPAPDDVNAICHDEGGSDSVQNVVMTALSVGSVH
jgi:hypothetical protein